MSSSATTSQGVQLRRNGTLVGKIMNITGPAESAPQIDVTSLDSTWREFIGGIPDGGEVSVELNYASGDAQQQGLRADLLAGTVQAWAIELNDALTPTNGTVISFSGVVINFSPSMAVGTQVKALITIKVSGAVTYTLAS